MPGYHLKKESAKSVFSNGQKPLLSEDSLIEKLRIFPSNQTFYFLVGRIPLPWEENALKHKQIIIFSWNLVYIYSDVKWCGAQI